MARRSVSEAHDAEPSSRVQRYIRSGKEFLRRLRQDIVWHDCFGKAAELAFFFQLAIFPLLIFLLSVIGFVPGAQQTILFWLGRLMPAEATSLLEHGKGMGPHLLEIQRLENEADDVYFRGTAELFKSTDDPVRIIKWKELYEILENGTDRCESVANIIESIVLKHN